MHIHSGFAGNKQKKYTGYAGNKQLFGVLKYKIFTGMWQALVSKSHVKEGVVCHDEERICITWVEKLF